MGMSLLMVNLWTVKMHIKAEADKQKVEKDREKRRLKEERKQYKLEQKEKRRQERKDKEGRGGWYTAVISLSVCVVVLATLLTLKVAIPSNESKLLEASYQKSFYDTVAQVDNIDVNLSKAINSKDKGALQTYLLNTAINSELCENDLQQLPLKDESKFYKTKLINQIGDYSKYLNKKISDGNSLDKQDYDNLSALYKANLTLKNSLQNMIKNMDGSYSFSDIKAGVSGDIVVDGFNQLQNLSVEYPELIYDGPFSDGLDRKEVLGLSGDDVSKDEAQSISQSIFSDYSVNGITYNGETGGIIDCYNFTLNSGKGDIYVQISKTMGKLIMFSLEGSCKETNYGEDYAIETATGFLAGLGLIEMQPVWVNLSNNLYTINYAYLEGSVVVYPDMIKVRVCAETNMVIGVEASAYYINHTARNIGLPSLTSYKAQENVSDNLTVESSRLTVVPYGNGNETLCYEFYCNFQDSVYYVYIDAKTGRQVEMFLVIESTEGKLLI